MLVVARELKQEAHTCLSCHCSWPAPGSLRRSWVCERLWLRPPLLMWPQHCSWTWQVTTLFPRLTPAHLSSPYGSGCARIILTSGGPWHIRVPSPQPPFHGFVTLSEHVCIFWAISHVQFLNTHHVGECYDYHSATAQHTEGQLWGNQGPRNHVVMCVNIGQW